MTCGEESSDGIVDVIVGVPIWNLVGGVGCGRRVGRLLCCYVDDLVAWDTSMGRNPPKVYGQPGGDSLVQGLQELYQMHRQQTEQMHGLSRVKSASNSPRVGTRVRPLYCGIRHNFR